MWLCKRNLSKECEGKYKNCTDCVLDKIRAEIFNACSDNYHMPVYKLSCEEIFEIIDKYKAESEAEAWNTQEGGDICEASFSKY